MSHDVRRRFAKEGDCEADEAGLTTVYKLPVPALSIFPDATSSYCIVK